MIRKVHVTLLNRGDIFHNINISKGDCLIESIVTVMQVLSCCIGVLRQI